LQGKGKVCPESRIDHDSCPPLMPQDWSDRHGDGHDRFYIGLQDMGLSMATVQRAEINHGQVSTLFWINIAISAT
jgi:hypothetical protein